MGVLSAVCRCCCRCFVGASACQAILWCCALAWAFFCTRPPVLVPKHITSYLYHTSSECRSHWPTAARETATAIQAPRQTLAGVEFDMILFGATGFTGKLCAEYLAAAAGTNISYAVAGRSKGRLDVLVEGLQKAGPFAPKASLVVDGDDLEGLRAMVRRTRVVITAAGPYPLYGTKLVQACAEEGTHYADMNGDRIWSRNMVDANHEKASKSGAKIVLSAGYDSLVNDLGVVIALEALGMPKTDLDLRYVRVAGIMTEVHGGVSFGTLYAGAISEEPINRGEAPERWRQDPYVLIPEGHGCRVDASIAEWSGLRYRPDIGFGFPGVMSIAIAPHVRRSLHMLGYRGVSYSDGMTLESIFDAMAWAYKMRDKGGWDFPTKSGDGPSAAMQSAGGFKVLFAADDIIGSTGVKVEAVGNGDPGYAHTSKLLVEMGLCLLDGACHRRGVGGGVMTPAVAGDTQALRDRVASAKHEGTLPLLTYRLVNRTRAKTSVEL